MFFVGSQVQVRDTGCLGTVVKIASARQMLTVETTDGRTVRLRGSDVRTIDDLEWRMLSDQQAQEDQEAEQPSMNRVYGA